MSFAILRRSAAQAWCRQGSQARARARRRGADAERQATPDGTLVKALARAWRWQRLLDAGVYSSVTEIAAAEGIGKPYVSRILRLALLAPDIIEGIVEGRADEALMLERLERPLPASWEEQRRLVWARGVGLSVQACPVWP